MLNLKFRKITVNIILPFYYRYNDNFTLILMCVFFIFFPFLLDLWFRKYKILRYE